MVDTLADLEAILTSTPSAYVDSARRWARLSVHPLDAKPDRTAFIKQPGMFLRAAAWASAYLRRRLGVPRRRIRFRLFGHGPLDGALRLLAAHLGLDVVPPCRAMVRFRGKGLKEIPKPEELA